MSAFSGTNVKEPQLFTGPGLSGVDGVASPVLECNEAGGLVQLNNADLLKNDVEFTVSKISTGTNGIQVNCPAGWTVNGVLNTALILPGSQAAQVGEWLYYTKIRLRQIVVSTGGAASSGVTSVTASAPVVSSGGATPNITMGAASSGAPGYMSQADKIKLDSIKGTVVAQARVHWTGVAWAFGKQVGFASVTGVDLATLTLAAIVSGDHEVVVQVTPLNPNVLTGSDLATQTCAVSSYTGATGVIVCGAWDGATDIDFYVTVTVYS